MSLKVIYVIDVIAWMPWHRIERRKQSFKFNSVCNGTFISL